MRKMAIASLAIGGGLRAIFANWNQICSVHFRIKMIRLEPKFLRYGQNLNFEQKCILDVWDMAYSEQTWKRLRCFGQKYWVITTPDLWCTSNSSRKVIFSQIRLHLLAITISNMVSIYYPSLTSIFYPAFLV